MTRMKPLLRLGYVTDIHSGSEKPNKRGSKAPQLTQKFVRVSNRLNVDLVVIGGDLVQFQDGVTQAMGHLRQLKNIFSAVAAPLLYNLGNHERYLMSSPALQKFLDMPDESYVRKKNGFTVIMWNPNVLIDDHGLSLRPSDLEWLQKTLNAATSPCIVSTHVPLDNDSYDDHHVQKHDRRPFVSFYPQGPDARNIIEESGKVIMCLAGHRHRNRHREINGIHYLTRQSLVQADRMADPPYGAFSMIDIYEDTIKVKGFGRQQKSMCLSYCTPSAFTSAAKPIAELEIA